MDWYWYIIILAAAFVYVNIGYLYASWCVECAIKNVILQESRSRGSADEAFTTYNNDTLGMFLVAPFSTIFHCDENEIRIQNENSNFINAIALNIDRVNNTRDLKYAMILAWPFQFLWIATMLCVVVIIVGICLICLGLFKALIRPIALLLTWPIRKITKLNSL